MYFNIFNKNSFIKNLKTIFFFYQFTQIKNKFFYKNELFLKGINFWRARTKLERCLLCVCIGLSIFTFTLLFIDIKTATRSKNEWEDAQILHVSSNSNYHINRNNKKKDEIIIKQIISQQIVFIV